MLNEFAGKEFDDYDRMLAFIGLYREGRKIITPANLMSALAAPIEIELRLFKASFSHLSTMGTYDFLGPPMN
uniref:Uncharacterized protein n=1 Tax=Utricularia reniformis TaxID=192314 RepID=A0A1Y0B362_9LAMI|nr:hypothetical protein AEK19_MT1690 [Utricularia reniformis]ART31872.1 hypothetical protein AEK19_MT1690 [Utricularia reniformis]